MSDLNRAVEHLLRELAPQVLGAIARRYNDFASAEEAVQDAMLSAATQWTVDGVPDNPRGWLYRVAARRIMDTLRSEHARKVREDRIATMTRDESGAFTAPLSDMPYLSPFDHVHSSGDSESFPDDSLLLLFMCCHPALSPASAIALTLRAVGGLTTLEIANAFLVPEATIAQRISRVKATIKLSQITFAAPTPGEGDARLQGVLHVLYLIFNEGYATLVGDTVHRADSANDAIRLTRIVYAAIPGSGSVVGLLALMLLTAARRAARTGALGEPIPLEAQDRRVWKRIVLIGRTGDRSPHSTRYCSRCPTIRWQSSVMPSPYR